MVNVKLSTFLMTMSTIGVMYTTASPVNHKLARREVTHDGDDLEMNVMKRQWYSPWYRPPPPSYRPSFPYNPWNDRNGENQGSTTVPQSMTSASTTAASTTKPKPSITNTKPTSSVGLLHNLHPISNAHPPAPTTTKANNIPSGKAIPPNVTHRPESQTQIATHAASATQSVQPSQSQSTDTNDNNRFNPYDPARPWQPYQYQYQAPPPAWYGRPWYAHRRDEGADVYEAYQRGYYGRGDDEGLQARWY